jgi:excisionase family DNA binding protein
MDREEDAMPFLTVRETAKLLGVHENTVRNWVAAGTLVSARPPGATAHRFAREEVERLQKKRGEAVSSIAPMMRSSGELVTASQLDGWAPSDAAKGAFPELMRRLLAVTPGITNVDIRAHEGTAAPGWDGTATSAGSTYLPPGELRFEFGTENNSKGKAQSDFDKRAGALPKDATSIFVFATPRNWAGGKAWAVDRADENKFAGVKAIDAHVLEGWLQASPSVHYWISEQLGLRPRDAQTIERWWNSFRGRTTVALPAAFVTAGRDAEVEELRTLLTGAGQADEIITIRAPWRDEALAFLYAAIDNQADLRYRTLVVTDEGAWQRLTESKVPLVLVPIFDGEPDLSAASENGHRVLMVAEPDDVVRHGKKVELRKINRVAAREALKEVVPDSDKAEAMVALGRRSFAALVRHVARAPRFRAPDWVRDAEQSAVLAPLVLAGSWSNSDRDLAAVEKLTGGSRDDVDRLLKSLAGRPDAPFVRSGGMWRLTSPTEAALLLLPKLTANDLARWREVVSDVLLEPDPYQGMDTVARLTASATGTVPTYSEILKRGLAEGLALAAASDPELPPELQMQNQVDFVVRSLLDEANAEATGEVWARIAHVLPLLAEAAPESFQDAVELDLDRSDPVLRTMFKDQGSDTMFGPSSPHPNLLWAIETLCWSPEFFGRAAFLLGRLSSLDPGGRLSNRPIESLQNVTAGWLPQSGAGVDEKLAVIERLLQRNPDVGWKLAMGVWPTSHAVAFPPHAPSYRDWSPTAESVTFADWGRFIESLVTLSIAAAATSPSRWQELVPKIDDLPPRQRHVVIQRLREVVDAQDWSAEDRYAVWESLTSEADRHEEYAHTKWAMPADDIALLRSVADDIAPDQDPRRFSNLFDWRAHVPNLKRADEGYAEELTRLQSEALDQVIAQGADALKALVLDVKTPHSIGHLLAQKQDAPELELLSWLGTAEPNLRQAVLTFAAMKIGAAGIAWLEAALANPAVADPASRETLMAAVPFAKKYWTQVSTLGDDLEAAYWQRVQHYQVPAEERPEAVRLLLQHKRPWEAVALLSDAQHDHQDLDIELIKEVFRDLRTATAPTHDATMSSYYIENLLEYMEQHAPDDEDLPGFEFMFFEFLHDHHPSAALYRALNKNPAEFVDLVNAVFRAEGEAKRVLTAQEQSFAHIAWGVLREWPTIPGLSEDGTIDTAHLTEWVRTARLALADSGRSSIGDEQVGQVLAASPVGADGVWPAEAVREIIENVGNPRIDTGLHIGKTNQRGVSTRGVFDGGDQERVLENEYREMAAKIATKWPRTARILRGIADSYQREARRHDAQAERLSDDG